MMGLEWIRTTWSFSGRVTGGDRDMTDGRLSDGKSPDL